MFRCCLKNVLSKRIAVLSVSTIVIGLLLPVDHSLAAEGTDKKFGVNLGVFITSRDTQTDFRSNLGGDSDVDMEDDLGLDSSDSVFRIDGFWRFATRHQIDISYFDLSRQNSRVIDTEFEWKDTVYEIDTEVFSDFDLRIYKAAYTYEFMKRERGSLGVTAGLYVADLGISISSLTTGGREVGDVTAPLPVFGLRGEYALSARWTLRGSAELFAFEIENLDGTMYDVYAGIDYHLGKNVAIGLAINTVGMDLDASRRNLEANLDWRYDGALAYLRFVF